HHLGSIPVALCQVFPAPSNLGGVDHASRELVEVWHEDMGSWGVARLPCEGHQEPGPDCGAAEEGEGEEDASHGSTPSASMRQTWTTLWPPAESAIGSAQTPVLPKPCAPRSVVESSSTTSTSTRATGAITSWA